VTKYKERLGKLSALRQIRNTEFATLLNNGYKLSVPHMCFLNA